MMPPDMRQVTPKLRYKFTEAASLYMTRDTKLKPYRLGREHNISNTLSSLVSWCLELPHNGGRVVDAGACLIADRLDG
jgi:hypothetical protein